MSVLSTRQAPERETARLQEIYRFAMNSALACMGCATASIYFREDSSGDFVCIGTNTPEGPARIVTPPLRFKKDAFMIRRLERLRTPLAIDAGELEAWERGLEKSMPDVLAARRDEIETLRIARARMMVPIAPRGDFRILLVLSGRKEHGEYTSSDREYVGDLAAQAAVMIEDEGLLR